MGKAIDQAKQLDKVMIISEEERLVLNLLAQQVETAAMSLEAAEEAVKAAEIRKEFASYRSEISAKAIRQKYVEICKKYGVPDNGSGLDIPTGKLIYPAEKKEE